MCMCAREQVNNKCLQEKERRGETEKDAVQNNELEEDVKNAETTGGRTGKYIAYQRSNTQTAIGA